MTGATIRIEADIAAAREKLARIREAAGTLRPVMEEVGAALRQHVDERFEGGHGPFKAPWKKSRRALEAKGQTLIERGRLRQSITFAADDDSVEVGTNVEYGAIHQFGGEIKQGAYTRKVAFRARELGGLWTFLKKDSKHRGRFDLDVSYGERVINMPARPYLGFDAVDEAEIVTITTDHLRQAAGSATA